MAGVGPKVKWKPVVIDDQEMDYLVSSDGRVWSKKSGRELKPSHCTGGYPRVAVSTLGKVFHVRVHTLVARAFLNRPSRDHVVNHIDGDKTNNVLDNLEWVTRSENTKHAFKAGLIPMKNVKKTVSGDQRPYHMAPVFSEKDFLIEVWAPVPIEEYSEVFSVSSLGRIRRESYSKRAAAGSIKKSFQNKQGYFNVQLRHNTVVKTVSVHRLVAEAFLPGSKKSTVNHKNMNRADNRLENLEWATRSENLQHAFDNGRRSPSGSSHYRAKLTEKDVREIRALYEQNGISMTELGRKYETSTANIRSIVTGKSWKEVA